MNAYYRIKVIGDKTKGGKIVMSLINGCTEYRHHDEKSVNGCSYCYTETGSFRQAKEVLNDLLTDLKKKPHVFSNGRSLWCRDCAVVIEEYTPGIVITHDAKGKTGIALPEPCQPGCSSKQKYRYAECTIEYRDKFRAEGAIIALYEYDADIEENDDKIVFYAGSYEGLLSMLTIDFDKSNEDFRVLTIDNVMEEL